MSESTVALNFVVVLVGLPLFAKATYHAINMGRRIKQKQRNLIAFTGLFGLFIPAFFTDEGNYHRRMWGIYMSAFLLWIAAAALVSDYLLDTEPTDNIVPDTMDTQSNNDLKNGAGSPRAPWSAR